MSDVREFEPDGLHLQEIKRHSLEKISLHNYYAEIFTAGMRKSWPNLVYIGLYSGSGAGAVDDSDRVIMTSALSVLTQSVPFTRYIFVDKDTRCASALEARAENLGMSGVVKVIAKSVNDSVDDIIEAMPDWRREGGVLTFCFIDPYKIDLDFNVIRRLAGNRIDFLLMIPLGYDLRRNWRAYLEKPVQRDCLSNFLGDAEWVKAWSDLKRPHTEFPRFVQDRMNDAMKRLKFIEVDRRDIRDVKVADKNVYLYSLHLYSKSEVAIRMWREALRGTSQQRLLDI